MAIVDKQETCVEALAHFLTILTAFHHDLAGSICSTCKVGGAMPLEAVIPLSAMAFGWCLLS